VLAYNFKDEIQEIIGIFDKNSRGDKIRVTRIIKEKSNTIYVDVRNMYTDQDGEIRPTQKGIRLNSEIAVDVICAMLEALGDEAIQDVLLRFRDSEK
jgi:hypothetical protein